MNNKYFILIIFVLVFNTAFCQSYFQRLLPGVATISSIYETPFKQYYLTGMLNQTFDGYIMKVDSNFNPIWSKHFPGHMISSILKINNGSYFGFASDPSIPFTSSHFFKIDELGNFTIIKSFSVNTNAGAVFDNIVQSGPNKIVVGGNIFGGGNPNDWFVTSLDTNGNINWAKRFGGWSADDGGHVEALPNGEILVAGEPESGNRLISNQNFGLIKLDSMGNYIWGKDFGSKFGEFGLMAKLTSDGKITYLGYGPDSITNITCPVVAKFDLTGNLIWIKKYLFKNNSIARSFDEDKNGNLFFAAQLTDTTYGNSVAVLKWFSFSIDSNGLPRWAKSYGDTIMPYDFSILTGVKIDSRNNLLLSGQKPFNLQTNTYIGGLIKADLEGNTYCKEKNHACSVLSTNHFYDIFDSSATVPITIISNIPALVPLNLSFSSYCGPASISTAINNSTICVGDCAVLTATVNGGVAPFSYTWFPNIGTGPGPYTVCPNSTNQYSLTVTDNINQTSISISTISTTSVNANLLISPTSGIAPLQINLTNQTVGASIYTINFGDSNSSTLVPSYIYNSPGTYTLNFIASNIFNCSDTLDFIIKVNVKCDLDKVIPNVFTPNEDGINDILKFNTCEVQKIDCKIFDRWGLLIAEINKPNGFWDGHTTSGEKCNDGTYFYILKITLPQEEEETLKGFVQLFR